MWHTGSTSGHRCSANHDSALASSGSLSRRSEYRFGLWRISLARLAPSMTEATTLDDLIAQSISLNDEAAILAARKMARPLFMVSFHSNRANESATMPPPAWM